MYTRGLLFFITLNAKRGGVERTERGLEKAIALFKFFAHFVFRVRAILFFFFFPPKISLRLG